MIGKRMKMQPTTTCFILTLLICLSAGCGNINPPKPNIFGSGPELDLNKIRLPEGFTIELYAEGVENARSLERSPNGTVFVGTRGEGKVYALRDEDGDNRADRIYTIAEDLKSPNGVAFRDGDLYVAEISRILKLENIEDHLSDPPEPVVVNDGYPEETHHGWKYIAFGPDGKLYVPVGAPCNICLSEDPVFASLTRMDPDGGNVEVVHRGIRNTVGFAWHPDTGELWFTDNGRDWMGDNQPPDELNRASRDDMHFGYPYCHGGDLPDPEFGEERSCSEFTPPVRKLGPHVAALGLEFYTGEQFPETYQGQIFIAEHGSWNRSEKIGYRIMLVTLEGNTATSYKPFAEGWLDEEADDVWGRPVDLELLPDGSMLVSDDFADAVYRISYRSEGE